MSESKSLHMGTLADPISRPANSVFVKASEGPAMSVELPELPRVLIDALREKRLELVATQELASQQIAELDAFAKLRGVDLCASAIRKG